MENNQNFLDALAVTSFLLGLANYGENLSQSDKDDMMKQLGEETSNMILRLEEDLNYQNRILEKQNHMLEEILWRLK